MVADTGILVRDPEAENHSRPLPDARSTPVRRIGPPCYSLHKFGTGSARQPSRKLTDKERFEPVAGLLEVLDQAPDDASASTEA